MANKLLSTALIAISLSSCVGTKTLYKGLTKEQSTIEYLYDSEVNSSEKTDTIRIAIPTISDDKFTKSGDLTKTKASAVPLIIYTGWKNEHEYFIGDNMIEEDIPSFIQKSIIEETNRSTLLMADSTSNSDMVLEINVETIGAHGPYRSQGYFLFLMFFYSYSFGESAGPGTASSELSYVLKSNDEVLLTGNATNQVETEPLVNNFKNTNELRKFFSSNLAEGISRTLKANVEQITDEVENYIANRR
ncbi:MAG: hypothetical protein RH948_19370 [Cyclobacteriaceae bacterium]